MKKLLSVLLISGMTLGLYGCGSTTNEDPQTVINKFLAHIAERTVTEKSGEIAFKGKGNLEVSGNKVDLNVNNVDVKYDNSDVKNTKSATKLDLDGGGMLEGKAGKVMVKGEVRMIGKKLYGFLEDLSLDTGDAQTTMMANLFGGMLKGKWNEFPDTDVGADASMLEASSMTPDQIREITAKYPFLTLVQDLGNRTYSVKFDVAMLQGYLTEIGKINNSPVKQEDMDSLKLFVDSLVNPYFEISVDDDYGLAGFKMKVNVDDPEKKESVSVNANATLDGDTSTGIFDVNVQSEDGPAKIHLEGSTTFTKGKQDVQAPPNPTKFDPAALFGGGEEDSSMGDLPSGMGDLPPGMPDLSNLPKN